MSTSTYATCRQLAADGHHVDVISNASEAEPGICQLLLPQDRQIIEDEYKININLTKSQEDHYYVPYSNPFFSKLFGLGLSLTNKHRYDAIYGSYLEPYGVVAAQLATSTQLPLILRHAGSDIGRLASHPDLYPTFRWALSAARAVLSTRSPAVRELLTQLAVPPSKIVHPLASRLPRAFTPQGPPLAVDPYRPFAINWARALGLPTALDDVLARPVPSRPSTGIPVLGVYGKVGQVKGSNALIAALRLLANEGYRFHFVALIGGGPISIRRFVAQLLEAGSELLSRTTILPFIAQWRIPEFLRLCDAACYLEHGFPISFHGSRIPREIIACGCSLICSIEMAEKLPFGSSFLNGKNAVLIPNPSDIHALKTELRAVLTDRARTRSIGHFGHLLSRAVESQFSPKDGASKIIVETAETFHARSTV